MSVITKMNPILGETHLYDGLGRFVGMYDPDTGRGMFAHTFFADERACNPFDEAHAEVIPSTEGRTLVRRTCDCGNPLVYDTLYYRGERHEGRKTEHIGKHCDECGSKFRFGERWWPECEEQRKKKDKCETCNLDWYEIMHSDCSRTCPYLEEQ